MAGFIPYLACCSAFLATCSVLASGSGLTAAGPGATSDLSAERAAAVGRQLQRLGSVGAGDEPIGVIEISRIGVHGEILEGVDDVTIRRAVGHFPETAGPFEPGNMALAAHRTTHFAGLRDVEPGDRITLRTDRGVLSYRVDHGWVVDPEEVWVLEPTDAPSLTLVTCYPFDHPGQAPQRFVVRATLLDAGGSWVPH